MRRALLLLAMAAGASAQSYRFTVVFDDGGTGSGSFSMSPYRVAMSTTPGAKLPGASYVHLCEVDTNCDLISLHSPIPVMLTEPRTGPALVLQFGAKTANGLALVGGEVGAFDNWYACYPACVRNVVSGEAVPLLPDVYQLHHFTLDQGDGIINITNAGTLDGTDKTGSICVNVYAFAPTEEIVSCCACRVTPNGLVSLSLKNDIMNNTLYAAFVQNSVTVALFATAAGSGTCNAATQPTSQNPARGMKAWGTTLHTLSRAPSAPLQGISETPFAVAELSQAEFTKLTSYCNFIQLIYSGRGQCKSCTTVIGAQGATAQ
jgi:hypothetical protein